MTDIRRHEYRHVRAEALHGVLQKLQDTCREYDFRDEIVVRPDGAYVRIDGLLLEALSQRIYLKSSGAVQHCAARAMNEVLARRGIRPKAVVDVGANYGEVSLWFAREYPDARILSIEPVRDNRAIFERNQAVQAFPTSNLQLVAAAVMDRQGTISITSGVSTMNRVVDGQPPGSEAVPCDRLEALMAQHGMEAADFVKVDIEGAEPYLEDSVCELGDRVRSWLFEYSKFAPLASYLDLTSALFAAGFDAFQEDGGTALPDMGSVERHLLEVLAPQERLVTNLWFFRS